MLLLLGGRPRRRFVHKLVAHEHGVVRVGTPGEFSVRAALDIRGSAIGRAPAAAVETLTSPLFGTAEFAEFDGGWNSPADPRFIAPIVSRWAPEVDSPAAQRGGPLPQYTLPPMSYVVMTWGCE